jgi:hypothetical protein
MRALKNRRKTRIIWEVLALLQGGKMNEPTTSISKLDVFAKSIPERKSLQIDLRQIMETLNDYGIDWATKEIHKKLNGKESEFVIARRNGHIIGFAYLERINQGCVNELMRAYGPFFGRWAEEEDRKIDFWGWVEEIYSGETLTYSSAEEFAKEVFG